MGFLYGGHFRIFCIVEHYTTPAIRSTSLSELYEYSYENYPLRVIIQTETYAYTQLYVDVALMRLRVYHMTMYAPHR